jgi:hypothetical protein
MNNKKHALAILLLVPRIKHYDRYDGVGSEYPIFNSKLI